MEPGWPSGRALLVPTDFAEPAMEALSVARELGRSLGLEIALLHVFTIPVVVLPGFDPIVTPGLPEEIASAAKRSLDEVASRHGIARTIVRAGDPATVILKVIEELHPALVVMGTRGKTGLSHWLLGSVAEKIVRASPVPVLTVRSPGSH